jgi:hypothetical protein
MCESIPARGRRRPPTRWALAPSPWAPFFLWRGAVQPGDPPWAYACWRTNWCMSHNKARRVPAAEFIRSGLPGDPLKLEADLLAEKVLAHRRLSPITVGRRRRDPSGYPNRPLSAFVIIEEADKAIPAINKVRDVKSGKLLVNIHLTNNFKEGRDDFGIAAWKAEAGVKVTAQLPQDAAELAKWHFGFIQFMEVVSLNAFYAGKKPSDGSILLHAHMPPAMKENISRDTFGELDFNPPWMSRATSGDKTFDRNTGVATSVMGDHPQLRIFAILENGKAGYPNFLFHLIDERKFFNVFWPGTIGTNSFTWHTSAGVRGGSSSLPGKRTPSFRSSK